MMLHALAVFSEYCTVLVRMSRFGSYVIVSQFILVINHCFGCKDKGFYQKCTIFICSILILFCKQSVLLHENIKKEQKKRIKKHKKLAKSSKNANKCKLYTILFWLFHMVVDLILISYWSLIGVMSVSYRSLIGLISESCRSLIVDQSSFGADWRSFGVLSDFFRRSFGDLSENFRR